LRTGRFPVNWKIAKILPIAKPGREKSADTSKYRPISLLNTEGKVLEKLLSKRITPPIHDRILKRKPIRIHTPKEYGRRCHASQTILRESLRKRGSSNNDQSGRTRSTWLGMVAGDTAKTARSKMPQKPLLPSPRLLEGKKHL
jgi:hypothetical protein